LQMPSHVEAENITSGVPQVELLARIIYSNTQGKQQSVDGQFLLSVLGAETRRTDYSAYIMILAFVVIAVAVIIIRKLKSRSVRTVQA